MCRTAVLLSVVVVVVVAVVLLFVYVCLRVLVCSCHPGDMVLGHACGMPPTGANIAVLLLKTWLAPDLTYT